MANDHVPREGPGVDKLVCADGALVRGQAGVGALQMDVPRLLGLKDGGTRRRGAGEGVAPSHVAGQRNLLGEGSVARGALEGVRVET